VRATKISTSDLPREHVDGQQELATIIDRALCGAENVTGVLRWLEKGGGFTVEAASTEHHLIYCMAGEAVIELASETYTVGSGAGVYVGPSEAVGVRQDGADRLKLFHLVVPIQGREQT
jgi:mannose-6-phosphate isomerase-like protein (cupin superfamily)